VQRAAAAGADVKGGPRRDEEGHHAHEPAPRRMVDGLHGKRVRGMA
jgi:hypothetical protein